MNLCQFGVQGDYNCQSERGGAIRNTLPSLGAPGMFAGGPITYRFKDCTDGTSHTLLIGESLPIYSTFRMYFASVMNVASTNWPPNYHRIDLKCAQQKNQLARLNDCYAHMSGYMSEHGGGFNTALTDGSVRFIAETIDYVVYQYLGDKADGKTIGEF